MSQRKLLIAGNWKMNGNTASARDLLTSLKASSTQSPNDIAVFPPYVYLPLAQEILTGSAIGWGGQDVSRHEKGAYTGEIAASMLADLQCKYVLVGHSERRQYHLEDNEVLVEKFVRARRHGLTPIFCIGETEEERDDGLTLPVVTYQLNALLHLTDSNEHLNNCIIAYEPVWAIGTGRTASPLQAQEVHASIRQIIAKQDAAVAEKVRILYGGSVKADNAAALFAMPDIDGGLIGGASLNADEFNHICQLTISK